MAIDRRTFLKSAGAGALLLSNPALARGGLLGGPQPLAASRTSKLVGSASTFLLHGDLHNHSLLSDGDGTPEVFYALLRDSGLDVAAITDHTTVSKGLPISACSGDTACNALGGLNDLSWEQWRVLADAANTDDAFTAIRGFEWSSPFQGHINVWFSEEYGDPLHDAGGMTGEGAFPWMTAEGGFPPAGTSRQVDEAIRMSPTSGSTMSLFWEWMAADPSRPVRHGGGDAICGFNHPGREPGRFGYFDPRWAELLDVSDRVVSLELFNRREDYLFEGLDSGSPSPLVDCLDKGWKVGILGVTDEHSPDWANPRHEGKGRTGLWVSDWSREGVKEAMLARRFFATNLHGLRLDATLDGTRMGQTTGNLGPSATVALDIDRGPEWVGRMLNVQVLASGYPMPHVVKNVEIQVPGPSQDPVTFEVDVDTDDRWLVVRVTDPALSADKRADSVWESFGRGIAYASPFFIQR